VTGCLKTDPAVSIRLQLPVAQFRGILTKSQDKQRKNNRSTPWKENKECTSQCTTLLGGYWGVLGPDFRTVGPKRRPGPKWSPAAGRPVPGRPKRGLQVCMSRTRDGSRRLETATGFRVL